MQYASVGDKTALNIFLLIINIFTSIPVYIIAIALIFTQIWFVIMALVAPFALLIASFPSQFNVVKRYFFEFSLSLFIYVGLHFVLIVFFILICVCTIVIHSLIFDYFV